METVNDINPPTDAPPYRRPGNRLTRSTDDKVVGGLAGGLGRYFGIDPVVFRIAFVVLTLAGGSGVLLYLVGWVMIPDDAGGNALRRVGGERHQKLVAAVLAGIGVLILLDNITDNNDGIPLGLALIGIGALFFWTRNRDAGAAAGPLPPAPPAPPSPPAPPAGAAPTLELPPAPPSDAEPPAGVTGASPPPPPTPPKPRSALVPVTFSLLLVLAGGLTLAGVSPRTGVALALLLTGGALILGAWRGRARWLIPVGLVLSLALAGASVMDDVPVRGGAGDVAFRPLTVEEIRTPYRLGAGEMELDLSALDLRGGTVRIVASVAAGHLDVVVPKDVAVDIRAHVGAGELRLLGRHTEGLDIDRALSDPGTGGEGRLVLWTRAGIGMVEVRRAFP